MKLEIVQSQDTSKIVDIWTAHHKTTFSLPDRKHTIIEAKVVDKGQIIAYGQVRHLAEPIMVLDLDATPRQKYLAMRLLFEEACRGIEQAGLNRMLIFSRDPVYNDLLIKHFGFERTDPGEFLTREV